MLSDLYVGFFDAIVLMLITAYFGYRLFRNRMRREESEVQQAEELPYWRAAVYLVLGLALLILSAEALVQAASSIALRLESLLLLSGSPSSRLEQACLNWLHLSPAC